MKISVLTLAALAIATKANIHNVQAEKDVGCVVGDNGVQAADWRFIGLGCNCPFSFEYDAEKGCVFVEQPTPIVSTKTPSLTQEPSTIIEPSTVTPVSISTPTPNRCTVGENLVEAADFIDELGKCVCPASFAYDEEKGCVVEETKPIEPSPETLPEQP